VWCGKPHLIFTHLIICTQVVINCNVVSSCKYKKKSPDFHKFQDESGTVFGFGFYKREESLVEADRLVALPSHRPICAVLVQLVLLEQQVSYVCPHLKLSIGLA